MKLLIHSQTSTVHFRPHIMINVICYPCWDLSSAMSVKWFTGSQTRQCVGFTSLKALQLLTYQTPQKLRSAYLRVIFQYMGTSIYIKSFKYLTVFNCSSDVKISPNRMLKRDFRAAGLKPEDKKMVGHSEKNLAFLVVPIPIPISHMISIENTYVFLNIHHQMQ